MCVTQFPRNERFHQRFRQRKVLSNYTAYSIWIDAFVIVPTLNECDLCVLGFYTSGIHWSNSISSCTLLAPHDNVKNLFNPHHNDFSLFNWNQANYYNTFFISFYFLLIFLQIFLRIDEPYPMISPFFFCFSPSCIFRTRK